jgi:F0F1-type ATP synthase delta subunit
MKHISPKKYATSLLEALQGVNATEQTHLIESFVKLLAKHKMFGKVDRIITHLKLSIDQQQNIKTVKVSSAEPLDKKLKQELIDNLEKELKYKIEILEIKKPDLVGGVVIEYDNIRIDGSIKKKLELLSQKLHS